MVGVSTVRRIRRYRRIGGTVREVEEVREDYFKGEVKEVRRSRRTITTFYKKIWTHPKNNLADQ